MPSREDDNEMNNDEELDASHQSVIDEIRDLERRLQDANERLNQTRISSKPATLGISPPSDGMSVSISFRAFLANIAQLSHIQVYTLFSCSPILHSL